MTDPASPALGPSVSSIPPRLTWGLVAVGLAVSFSIVAHGVDGDGRYRFDALQALLGGSGIPTTKYPLIGSLPAIPLILLGHVIATPEWWAARYNVLVYGVGLVALFGLLRNSLPGDVLAAFLLLLGTTAMFPNSLTGFGAEAFSAIAVGTGLLAWAGGRWKTGALVLALGVANTPATVVGLALALGWWAWRDRRLRAAVPLVLAVTLWMLDNLVRRGSPLTSGYEHDHGYQTLLPFSGLPGFSYPILFGMGSLIMSSGKGLLFFTPGLALAFGRKLEPLRPVRDAMIMWLLFLLGMVMVYGAWWAWYGGYAWGPRFLLFASLPATLLLATFVRRPPHGLVAASAVLVVLALSVWVGTDGQTYGQFAQGSCTVDHYSLEAFCWYVPEFSVLWTPLVFHAPFSWRYPVIFAYALGTSIYAAWPLMKHWVKAVRRDASAAWAARRAGPAWRF